MDRVVSDADLSAALVACGVEPDAARAAAAAVGLWSAAVGSEVQIDLHAAASVVAQRLVAVGGPTTAGAVLALTALVAAAVSGRAAPRDDASAAVAALIDAVGVEPALMALAMDRVRAGAGAGAPTVVH